MIFNINLRKLPSQNGEVSVMIPAIDIRFKVNVG